MNYLFTSESVSEGHPDKVADQISDAILDQFMMYDPQAKVAVETLVTTGQVVVAGEIKSQIYVDLPRTVRETIARIGYHSSATGFDARSCGILTAVHEQSSDINRGVVRAEHDAQGAGDQGMMFGYACNEAPEYMPLPLYLAHLIMRSLAAVRKETDLMPYLRPDAKSQVTVEYDGDTHRPVRIHTIVLSTQHNEPERQAGESQDQADERMLERIEADVRAIVLPRVKQTLQAEGAGNIINLFDNDTSVLVNPTGKFVIGGPAGDTGLTGRKIIVDTYGGRGAHGGGAFSGKDPSKVDRSAAYAARHIAKNAVAAGVADEMLVQVAYAIGKAEPVSFFVNTYGTSHVALTDAEIAGRLEQLFDMRPAKIIERLNLCQPIYEETAAYGHMGRKPEWVEKHFTSAYDGERDIRVKLFSWEELNRVDELRQAFNLK